jgi:hypothetical protein
MFDFKSLCYKNHVISRTEHNTKFYSYQLMHFFRTNMYWSFKLYWKDLRHFRNHSNMFQSSMRSSSESSLFISLSMLLILKIIKIFKQYHQLIVAATTTMNWWSFLNILIIFNISNIDKDINKELPEDDLIEDRNMLQCFLKCFKWF